MLDENLPIFRIKPSADKPKHQSAFYFSQGGHEAQPAYSLRHLDPSAHASRNRYGAGICDAFIPDVVFAEVLLIPKWTLPTLSQDAIRANGGVQPPPEPILPTEFTIQLYNPDQQVRVRHRPKTWNSSAAWEFEMPQQTFRQPSASALDKTMSDPAASDTTPKLRFNWRKDGRKDLGCYLSGTTASLADGTRNKSKEPDITVAIFKSLKEITLYEPNLYRVEMEDFKGLELVLLLAAVVIRDVYFGNIKECFHISSPPKPGSPTHTSTRMSTTPVAVAAPVQAPVNEKTNLNGAQTNINQQGPPRGPPNGPEPPAAPAQQPPKLRVQPPQSHPHPHPQQQQQQQQQPPPPPADPRTQWELDQETRHLKQQTETEARERRRREKEANKRTKKLLEEEQKETRKRQARIDQETARLQKLYGEEEAAYRKHKQQQQQHQHARPPPVHVQSRPHLPPRPQHRLSSMPEGHAPSFQRPQQPPRPVSVVSGLRPPQPQTGGLRERRSIFDLFKRSGSDERSKTLHKKQSSMF